MIKTKNVMLGIVGFFVIIYMTLIGLNVHSTQRYQQQLELVLPRAMQHALTQGIETKDETVVGTILQEELEMALPDIDTLDIETSALDVEKGILSIKVSMKYNLMTGKTKTHEISRTVLLERQLPDEPKYKITFWVDEEIYKEYQVVKGENCPLPKLPSNYTGWIESGSENDEFAKGMIQNIICDKVYIAAMD